MQFLQRNWFCRNAAEVPQWETEPNHIVPRMVLVAGLFPDADVAEAQRMMQPDAAVVWQRNAGVGVHLALPRQQLDALGHQRLAYAVSLKAGAQVDRQLHIPAESPARTQFMGKNKAG